MADMLTEELKNSDRSADKLHPDYLLYHYLANLYTYQLLDFKKAFAYNAHFKEKIEQEVAKKNIERASYLELLEQYSLPSNILI